MAALEDGKWMNGSIFTDFLVKNLLVSYHSHILSFRKYRHYLENEDLPCEDHPYELLKHTIKHFPGHVERLCHHSLDRD